VSPFCPHYWHRHFTGPPRYSANMIGNPLFAKLPTRFQWTFHNIVAHPMSELLFQIGFEGAGNRFHDWSMPLHKPEEEGRG
jgi:hypothetical protein